MLILLVPKPPRLRGDAFLSHLEVRGCTVEMGPIMLPPPLPSTPGSPTKKRGGRTGADGTPRSEGQVEKLNLERRTGIYHKAALFPGRKYPGLCVRTRKHRCAILACATRSRTYNTTHPSPGDVTLSTSSTLPLRNT
ncbi:hypothetical protein CCM_07167 [Cordyceps militaris CM01]|uniref:Uncharacterized protein n=1 Tax=Cordyceps militaris (strain CM01) TaxID=983644 RepID=G3JM23_CORMM|nr:uncharacterized protein CCM_07167 [Cordyceps militaris CM01]EGX90747.1 hypothetical protein CCM_07167 [Cordyceps militaris CM01]